MRRATAAWPGKFRGMAFISEQEATTSAFVGQHAPKLRQSRALAGSLSDLALASQRSHKRSRRNCPGGMLSGKRVRLRRRPRSSSSRRRRTIKRLNTAVSGSTVTAGQSPATDRSTSSPRSPRRRPTTCDARKARHPERATIAKSNHLAAAGQGGSHRQPPASRCSKINSQVNPRERRSSMPSGNCTGAYHDCSAEQF